MATREEIREGIKKFLQGTAHNGYYDGLELRLIEELASQGVVIKVDRELPYATEETVFGRLTWPVPLMDPAHGTYIEVYRLAQQDLGEAGFVAVEPLIKE